MKGFKFYLLIYGIFGLITIGIAERGKPDQVPKPDTQATVVKTASAAKIFKKKIVPKKSQVPTPAPVVPKTEQPKPEPPAPQQADDDADTQAPEPQDLFMVPPKLEKDLEKLENKGKSRGKHEKVTKYLLSR
ncbi:MAG: hypothetical protein KW788_01620 [Candidatus Doudnabacteria bacterium]|nr:hypothetical protein [Candidatus Doudnabacteria bacterium]